MSEPWFAAPKAVAESGYGTLLFTVAASIEQDDPHAAEALRRAAVVVEHWARAVTAAAEFVTHEGGKQTAFGERWYAVVDALGEAGALERSEL